MRLFHFGNKENLKRFETVAESRRKKSIAPIQNIFVTPVFAPKIVVPVKPATSSPKIAPAGSVEPVRRIWDCTEDLGPNDQSFSPESNSNRRFGRQQTRTTYAEFLGDDKETVCLTKRRKTSKLIAKSSASEEQDLRGSTDVVDASKTNTVAQSSTVPDMWRGNANITLILDEDAPSYLPAGVSPAKVISSSEDLPSDYIEACRLSSGFSSPKWKLAETRPGCDLLQALHVSVKHRVHVFFTLLNVVYLRDRVWLLATYFGLKDMGMLHWKSNKDMREDVKARRESDIAAGFFFLQNTALIFAEMGKRSSRILRLMSFSPTELSMDMSRKKTLRKKSSLRLRH